MKSALASLLAMISAVAVASPPEVETGTLIPGKEPAAPVGTTGRYVRGPETTEVMPDEAAIAAARAMAGCAIGRKPEDVQQALNAADWRTYILATQKLSPVMSRCAGKVAEDGVTRMQIGFGPPTYFGILSEAWLIKKGMPHLDAVAYTTEAPSFAWLSRNVGDSVVFRLADCLAHKEPERVEALVRSKPLSAQEAAGFASIRPVLPTCLDSNVTLNASKTKLRLALATAIYRRSAGFAAQQAEARH